MRAAAGSAAAGRSRAGFGSLTGLAGLSTLAGLVGFSALTGFDGFDGLDGLDGASDDGPNLSLRAFRRL